MLKNWTGPGLFVTSAVRRAGKTHVAGAIAWALNRQGLRVAAIKPVDTHCVTRREGLVSEDAELLAHLGDVPYPLDIICPIRSREGVPRALRKELIDWTPAQRSLDEMRASTDVLVVEGSGGLVTPLDTQSTNLDMVKWLKLPAILCVRPGDEALDQMLWCSELLHLSSITLAGIVVNAYNPEKATSADEKLLGVIERRTRSRLLAVLPEEPASPTIGQGAAEAASKVDWASLAEPR